MKKTFLLSTLLAASISVGAVTATDMETKIDDLIGKMTLEEKIGQLNQLSGFGYKEPMVSQVKGGVVGSILNEVDPETVNRLQKEAVENSRLGIPLVFARDVIHGFKTIFPIPLGQAATWNPVLVEEGSRIAADEASSVGIRWTFSPMVDIARDARWGRIAEGYGEDPVLTAAMGVAAVKGYQGDDLSCPNTMAACVKHFAAYGASESGKDYNTTWIPTELLHDVYLPPFEAGAHAGAATFMCSFNDINGVPSSGNAYLLRTVLRDKWNWDGLMVSDWGSIQQMIPHGFSADLREAASQAAHAGVDMDMEGYAYIGHLKDLVEKGELDVAVIDGMVRNVLRLKYRLGLFENPYVDLATSKRFYTAENLDAARRTAEESAVLLTNDKGILPLKGVKKIFVTGPMADAKHDQNGTWCFDLEKEHTVTPLESLREMYGEENIVYLPGLEYSRDRNTAAFKKACKAAAKCDVILFFGGEEAVLSGEAHCRADISLPGAQSSYLAALKQTGKPVVSVIMTGRPMTIGDVVENSAAVVYLFHPGTMGGPAIANILSGKVNPSGKLPVSLPRMVGQLPLYYAHKNTGRPASGMTLINEIPREAGQTSTGCTSFFLDAGDGALFPFGYGLSYTTFEYGTPQLSSATMSADGNITVACQVTNTGKVAGQEVVQLYVRDLVGSLIRPVKELKAFRKISLMPGESQTVTFELPAAGLGYHNARAEKIIEPGEFNLWVGTDCQSGTPVSFHIR